MSNQCYSASCYLDEKKKSMYVAYGRAVYKDYIDWEIKSESLAEHSSQHNSTAKRASMGSC